MNDKWHNQIQTGISKLETLFPLIPTNDFHKCRRQLRNRVPSCHKPVAAARHPPCSPQLYTAMDAWRQGSECTGVFWGIIWSKGSRNTSLASHCIFLIWATQKESTGTWGSLATFPKWKCELLLHNQGNYGRFSPTKLPNNRILFL